MPVRGQPGDLYTYDRMGRRRPVQGRRVFIDGVPVAESNAEAVKVRMAKYRAAQAAAAAQNLQALERPLKPPARKQT